jgi:hypothetical protein
MDAEFFCFNEHVEAAGQLVRYVTEFVDPTIALKVQNVETPDRTERYALGRRYAQLLFASIPPEREIGIEANTTLELFGNRIYLRMYWPILVEGYYHYQGLDDRVRGLYWTTREARFFPYDHGLRSFLPAIAVRDQMVLVPRGQNDILEEMGSNAPNQPPLQRGVIEVDFADEQEVEQAFVTIGQQLRRELRRELLAYHSFDLGQRSDLDTVSAHLGVPPSLLRHALREESDSRELIYRQLRCALVPTSIVMQRQTRVRLQVENPSALELGRLRVQLRGPTAGLQIYPERVEIELPSASTASADFSIVATREGEFALEVLFLEATQDLPREMLPLQQLWLTSVPSD